MKFCNSIHVDEIINFFQKQEKELHGPIDDRREEVWEEFKEAAKEYQRLLANALEAKGFWEKRRCRKLLVAQHEKMEVIRQLERDLIDLRLSV